MINNKRRVLVAIIFVLVVLSTAVYVALRTPGRFERIQPGMSYGEVEFIMGRPADGTIGSAIEGQRFYIWQMNHNSYLWVTMRDEAVARHSIAEPSPNPSWFSLQFQRFLDRVSGNRPPSWIE